MKLLATIFVLALVLGALMGAHIARAQVRSFAKSTLDTVEGL